MVVTRVVVPGIDVPSGAPRAMPGAVAPFGAPWIMPTAVAPCKTNRVVVRAVLGSGIN